MEIHRMVIGFNNVNCYLVIDEDTKETVLIDPGDEAQRIISIIDKKELKIKYILLTHGHGDHIGAIKEVKEHTGAKLYVHVAELEVLSNPKYNLSINMPIGATAIVPDEEFTDSDTFKFGSQTLRVIHTPGHTPGGVCFYNEKEKTLFSGDTLFYSSVGRTDLFGGNHKTLIHSIQTKIMNLPDDVKVYPGHGVQTTIGFERRTNMFLKG